MLLAPPFVIATKVTKGIIIQLPAIKKGCNNVVAPLKLSAPSKDTPLLHRGGGFQHLQ